MGRRSATEDNNWVLPAHQTRSREQLQRLLEAGERVFAKRGFSETHVSEIVGEAQCSVGSFYRRFKDKEALFLALHQDRYEQAQRNIDRFFSNPVCQTSPITGVIFRLIRNTGTDALRIKGYYRALFEISLRGHNIWDQMRSLEAYQAQALHRFLLQRGYKKLRPDFLPAMTHAIRTIDGALINAMLHGPGPYEFNDPVSTCDFTRMMMLTAGITPDEKVLRKLRNARPARPAGTKRLVKTS
jgi:AcrR family transcriptional regulator